MNIKEFTTNYKTLDSSIKNIESKIEQLIFEKEILKKKKHELFMRNGELIRSILN